MREIDKSVEVYLLLHVDDLLVERKDRSEVDVIKRVLSSVLEMKDLGAVKKILV